MRCVCQRGQFSALHRLVNTLAKKSLGAYPAGMDIQKLIRRYGSQKAVAAAFGVTKGAVSQWVKAGAIPPARVWQLKAKQVKAP